MLRAFRLHATQLDPIQTTAASPDELTRLLPRGLYTTFSTNRNGRRVLGLTAHLERLYAPAQDMPPSASRADLRLVLAKLAADEAPGESRFRLIRSAADGMVVVIVQPFAGLPKENYERGVHVITADMTRHDPRLKDSGFINESRSARAQVGGEVFEVLLTKGGRIYEGMTSNFYAILHSVIARKPAEQADEAISLRGRGLLRREYPPRKDGVLVTAQTGILLGVTRRAVLRLARGQGIQINYRAPRVTSCEEFAEAFLTSSSRGVVPIVQINDSRVGQGRPGEWTKRLSLAYQAYVEERSEKLVE
jgi:branched-chain amino acid aminotransferase